MDAISTLLVPVDYFEPSLNALDVAIRLNHPKQPVVHLVCVLDPERMASSRVPLSDASADSRFGIETEKIQKLAALTAQKYQISCTGVCRAGNMIDELVAAANEFNAGLVVMNTHVGSDARAFRLNSDAYDVLKSAPCPVLTVPDQLKRTAFNQILLPVRPVAGALDKYELARMICQENDAQLTVLALTAPDEVISILQLEDELMMLKTKLAQDSIRSTILYYPTEFMAETVLEKANELTVDLIIITASLAITSSNFLVGPFSQQMIHNARVPVLSIRPDGNQEQTPAIPFWK